MTPLLARHSLRGSSETGVLADRALLVVTEYLNRGALPEDGPEILRRFRNRFDEARVESTRASALRAMAASSLNVVEASERALQSLRGGNEGRATTSPTLDEVMGVLDDLRAGQPVRIECVQLLREFLDRYSEETGEQDGSRLLAPGRW